MRHPALRALRRLLAMALLLGACTTAYRAEGPAVTANDRAAALTGAPPVTAADAPVADAPTAAPAPPPPPAALAAPDGGDAMPAPAPAPAASAPPPPAQPDGAGAALAPVGATVGSYTLSHNPDGSVARWDPCRPITWRANLTLAPLGALDDLLEAFDELGEATGMTFRYGGTTTAVPTGEWLSGTADEGVIVVAWAPSSVSDLWTEAADGRGGWYARGASRDGTSWTWRIVRGFVLIEPTATAAYEGGFGSGLTRGALLLHELAHAVGLSHVEDGSQLMYPTLGRDTAARYATGDLEGLALVGRAAGCIG